jgi:endoglucanase
MHEYLDSDNSGTHSTCAAGKGATALSAATNWLSTNGYQALLGEFAWTTDSSCTAEGPALMNSMASSSSQWVGWTWWTSGPFYGSYMFNLDPADLSNPVDNPQMATLVSNL